MIPAIGKSVGRRIPAEFFGMQSRRCSPNTDASLTPMHADLGYGVFRIGEPLPGKWRAWNPSPGVYQWDDLDAIIEYVEASGVSPLYLFGAPPDWAVEGPTGTGQVPTVSAYQQMIAVVADRYKGRGMRYELWNEANYPPFWSGTEAHAVEVFTGAAAIIKSADPSAIVYAPSITADGVPWLYRMVASGAFDGCNGLTYHPYCDPYHPERIISISNAVRAVADTGGFSKIIATEIGWGSYHNDGDLITYPTMMSDTAAAAYIVRMFLALWSSGADEAYYFGLDEDGANNASWSILPITTENDRSVLTAAGDALAVLIALVKGGNVYGHDGQSCRFLTADDRRGSIMWAQRGTRLVDTTGFASTRNALGAVIAQSSSYPLGISPIYCFH